VFESEQSDHRVFAGRASCSPVGVAEKSHFAEILALLDLVDESVLVDPPFVIILVGIYSYSTGHEEVHAVHFSISSFDNVLVRLEEAQLSD